MLTFEFEKPIEELEKRIEELRRYSAEVKIDASAELAALEAQRKALIEKVFSELKPYDQVLLARHPQRPYPLDYIANFCDDFVELHGDRRFSDDNAMVGGFATIKGHRLMLLGNQKGRGTKGNIERNFGMSHPEGYRKALRLMQLADRFGLPIVTLVDTAGAYPGIGAEERGQANAIAENLRDIMALKVPIISVIIGEGGSGGALAICICNRLLALSNSYYTVISPEGCASILFRDAKRAREAAEQLRLTARDLLELGVADEIVEEPLGGAHRDYKAAAENLSAAIVRNLDELSKFSPDELKDARYKKFREIGAITTLEIKE